MSVKVVFLFAALTVVAHSHLAAEEGEGAVQIDACTCFERGNYYTPLTSDNCRSYSQRTELQKAQNVRCPYGTQFDVKTCTCNYQASTVCPQSCPGTCTRNGNTYAQVPATQCSEFTQAAPSLPPQRQRCPAGLQFDLETCICNYPENTRCYQ